MDDGGPYSDMQSTATSSISIRGKTDPAWEHFSFKKEGRNTNVYTCLHCSSVYRGGGIYRMKQHLAGITGQISSCKKVPLDVRQRMRESLKQVQQKNQNKKLNGANEDLEGGQEVEDVQEVQRPTKKQALGKQPNIDNYFARITTLGSQPTLKSFLCSKEAIDKSKMAIARWFYDSRIPFSAIQSPYFQQMVEAIAAAGPVFRGPSYYELRYNLLGDCKKECQLLVESQRKDWVTSGCTIMADSWTDQRQRTLINFLVYCPTSTTFVKSFDVSDVVKDVGALFNLFCEVIEWVGSINVVHIVTHSAAYFVAVGKLIHERYEHIFWSPCAAHCLNFLLKDIESLPHVANLASKASKITVFVYNHMVFLSWLRKREGWKEIVRLGVTRSATTFITLKSLYDHKHDLQALAVDKHFTSHGLAKTVAGKAVNAIILDNKFWNDCLIIVTLVAPIIRLLKIVGVDEKPSLGYVYEGMQRAKNAIKEMFKGKEHMYKPYIDIINARWDKHLNCGLHATAYFLNPSFVYDENFEENKVTASLLDVLEVNSICCDIAKAIEELQLYRDRKGTFSRESALEVRKTTRPDQWWKLYGGSAPILQKLAIRLLSQASSSLGCERSCSFFDRIHTKERNILEHQRLNDLIFITYNLRLRNRMQHKRRSYDPIDYEFIDKLEYWVTEEEAPPEFDDQDHEIENVLYQYNAIPIVDESSSLSEGDEENEIIDEAVLEAFDEEPGVSGDSTTVDPEMSLDGIDVNECYDSW